MPSVGNQAQLGRTLGPRWSLARLLDVLGPWGRMLVYGGVGLLVSHLGSCRGEIFVTLSETDECIGSSTLNSWVCAGEKPQSFVHCVPAGRVMGWGPVGRQKPVSWGCGGPEALWGAEGALWPMYHPEGKDVRCLCPHAMRSGCHEP